MSHLDWVTIRMDKEHRKEIMRSVQHDRLVDEVLAARGKEARLHRFYAPLLAFMGKKMVAWGTTLQAKYSRIHTHTQAIASASRK